MPKRKDIKKIMIIGSGPIIISQGCEFDYSGTQACKALKEEGYKVVLVNSNPATIMTDPEFADSTYIEPVTPEVVEKIIAKERPDALLPTLGGQTGLNVSIAVAKKGVLKKYGVEMIGADRKAIEKAEDRDLFKKAMQKIGLDLPQSINVRSMPEAKKAAVVLGLPVVIRPSFTLGGTGGGIAFNTREFEEIVARGLEQSMIHEVLLEESVLGWKEFELEVMRDCKDNVVIVCSIENFDPMGVHTGDSITVAPAQTLTDVEYQAMRDAAIKAIREIGVATGGCNVQFAINPKDGRMVIIEINPRVSRSSALASKATGFPIAKIAAKLAVGYTLDEIPNDITKATPASFEPTIDYCVVKIPRFTFEKFPGADTTLGTSMKSVGEAMAIGRTFKEALQKGLRSLETKKFGLDAWVAEKDFDTREHCLAFLAKKLRIPNDERIFAIGDAIRLGVSLDQIHQWTSIDKWFLQNIKEIVDFEKILKKTASESGEIKDKLTKKLMQQAKEMGFSDKQLSLFFAVNEDTIGDLRRDFEILTTYKLVDTCAAEFEAVTPYYYSTYEKEDESRQGAKRKIMILGGGPNRIGQGIEFDYCCVHASFALRELGFETIMVNCNPETVSTDYDTSDKLYFEPMTKEDVLNIIAKEKPWGVIVQLGGQTPLNLTLALKKAGAPIIGTSPESIDIAEDREKFKELLDKLKLRQTLNGTARTFQEAKAVASRVGYPVLLRPSYVLGGRAMEIVYDEDTLERFIQAASRVSGEHPILIDKFLEDAIEVDVDMIADGETFVIGGILEHIEEAGIHSGDSAMVLPPYSLSEELINKIREATVAMARDLKVIGLMNVQYAVRDHKVYVLEVNPRASRTVPFVSKAIGVPLAKLAAKVMAGEKLKDLGFTQERVPEYSSVKESVFPFNRFPGVDITLGPEMKSTGEVMGIDDDFGRAYMKSQLAAGQILPLEGTVFVSVRDKDKRSIVFIVKRLIDMGFSIIATVGTARALKKSGIKVEVVPKVYEARPNILDYLKDGKINLIINTPAGRIPREDEIKIRPAAIMRGVPCITTISGAQASVNAIEVLLKKDLDVKPLQAYHEGKGGNGSRERRGQMTENRKQEMEGRRARIEKERLIPSQKSTAFKAGINAQSCISASWRESRTKVPGVPLFYFLFFIFFFLNLLVGAYADKVYLKDGKNYEGKLVGKSERRFLFSMEVGGESFRMSFFPEDVEKIELDKDTVEAQIPYLKEVESLKVHVKEGKSKTYELSLYKESQSDVGLDPPFSEKELKNTLNKEESEYYIRFNDILKRYVDKLQMVQNLYMNLTTATRDDFAQAKQYMDELYFELNNIIVPEAFKKSHVSYLESLKAGFLAFNALEQGMLDEASEQIKISEESKQRSMSEFRQVIVARNPIPQ